MSAEVGLFSLILALFFASLLALMPIAIQKNLQSWWSYTRPAVFGLFFFSLLSFICLIVGFLTDDFSIKYVAHNSHTELPLIYKISATWGAHEGSLLLWALILTGWTLAVSLFSKSLPEKMTLNLLGILGMISVGFLLFVLLTSNPFERLIDIPQQGHSLNPLLQDIGLAMHPPILYMGYVGFAVAFAFAIAVLLEERFEKQWARWARNWTLLAWAFLTLGIALGSWWAYYELGWGGWWFWDPVENASLLPWIAATALLHSLLITAARGSFQGWTLFLAILAFSLSLLGTFLVRSGVLTSVHAFTTDPSRGLFILVFLAIVVGSALTLFSAKAHLITQKKPLALFSRETALLLNNVMLMTILATVLLGTLYPLVLDALGIAKISVGAPYFNKVIVPFTLPLAILMGVGLMMHWQKNQTQPLLQKLIWPTVISFGVAIAVPYFLMSKITLMAFLGMFVSSWVAVTALLWWIKWQKTSAKSFASALAHIGFAIMLTGITLTSIYSIEKDVRLEPGQSYQLDQFRFEFHGIQQQAKQNYLASIGHFTVYENEQNPIDLLAEKRTYLSQTMPMTEAAIDASLTRDVFIALGEPLTDASGKNSEAWSVRLQYKPFIRWIWLGSIIMSIAAVWGMFFSGLKRRTVTT